MSRRVAADKRPKKQNLQPCPSRGRDSEVLREQAEYSRRSEDDCSENQCLPPGLSRLGQVPGAVNLKRQPLIKNVHNVFIDSYYPILQTGCSDCESSEQSLSSHGDTISRILASESLGLSRAAGEKVRNASAGGAARKPVRIVRQLHPQRETKSSDRTTPGQSSRSRLNLDSKTYTVFSCVSDADSVPAKADDGKGDERSGAEDLGEKEGNAKCAEGTEPPLAVDWFAQLCTRIETLEELLQRTLVNSFQLKECKCSESDPRSEKGKIKFLLPKMSKPISNGTSKGCESPTEDEEPGGKEIEDTDHEVQIIKERVKALELKLQQTKPSDFSSSEKPFTDFNHWSTPKSSTILSDSRTGDCCTCERWRFEGEPDGLRRLSSMRQSHLRDVRSGGKSEEEETDKKKPGKVKKKFIAKCRRFREICNSVVSSSRESSETFKVCKACNEVSYQQAIVTEEFLETFHRHPAFTVSALVDPDKQKNATLVYVKCQQETLAPLRGRRKRRRKKRKDLCRKTALTNFALKKVDKSQQWEEISLRKDGSDEWETENRVRSRDFEKVWTSGTAFGWARHSCRRPCTGDSRPRPLEHGHRNTGICECDLKKRKTRMASRPLRSPMEILKHGGHIKIPVLFKEVCKPDEPVQKVSNMSIKFVLVEEDTMHPLRKLMKKLSQRNSRGKEQYVFGVSKCCCGDEAVLAL